MNGRDLDIFKFGKVTAVPTNGNYVLWSPAIDFDGFLETAQTLSIASDSGEDAPAGGGATQIQITGLLEDGTQEKELVDLNGTTPVTTSNAFQFVSTAKVTEGEDQDPFNPNHGTINISAGATLMARIDAAVGRTQMAIYRVPSDVSGELLSLHTFVTNENDVQFDILTREAPDKPWNNSGSPNSESKDIDVRFSLPRYLAPGSDIMLAFSAASGATIAGFFEIQLRPLSGIST